MSKKRFRTTLRKDKVVFLPYETMAPQWFLEGKNGTAQEAMSRPNLFKGTQKIVNNWRVAGTSKKHINIKFFYCLLFAQILVQNVVVCL